MKRLRGRLRAHRKPVPELADLAPIEDLRELGLGARDVHIWLYLHDNRNVSELQQAYYGLLSPDEKARYAQFTLPERRGPYLSTRALCRWALSHYAQVQPSDWRFEYGPRGKPAIAAPIVSPPIWFSLAHLDNLSVCVVSRVSAFIGVDIESIDPDRPGLEIAESFFPRAEVAALRRLPPDRVPEEFVCRWVLKESFVKAREVSLGPGLAGAAFDLSDPRDVGVAFAEDLHERSANWRFELRRVAQTRILALAVRTELKAPLRLRIINYVPGRGVLSFPAELGGAPAAGSAWAPRSSGA